MALASREEGITEAQCAGQAGEGGGGGGGQNEASVRNIVFFDVETNVPGSTYPSYELLEFGAVVLDVRGLGELGSFHTLIRPRDLSCINQRISERNIITAATVADAPAFVDVADDIYQLLHGHIWAGHNILEFDIFRIDEAFSKIGRQAPQPFGVIDTYPLLRKTFGKRAGNYKLATLANYCGYGKQEHRSIPDVRMNINVLRSCATLLFLESNYPDILMAQMKVPASTSVPFLLASHVSLPSIEVREGPSCFGCRKMFYYNGFQLHLSEFKIKVRFTIDSSYAFDEKGKPRFSILLEPSEPACNVISKCEDAVKIMSAGEGEVEFLPTLRKESGRWAARMSIGTEWGGSFSTYTTEFFRCTLNGLEKLSLGHVDVLTFKNVIPHGCLIDVGFGLYVFNVNNRRRGVKLLAKYITLSDVLCTRGF